MMHYYYNDFGAFGFVSDILVLAFWALLIWLFVRLMSKGGCCRLQGREPSDNHALEILKERYAKGEIDKKEFEEKKTDLSK